MAERSMRRMKSATSASSAIYALVVCAKQFLEARENVEEELLRASGSSKELIAPTPTTVPTPDTQPSAAPEAPPPAATSVADSPNTPPPTAGPRTPPGRRPPPPPSAAGTAPSSSPATAPAPPSREPPTPRGAQKGSDRMETIMAQASLKLLTTLKNFVEVVSVRAPHLSSEIVREAQFVLAGFADETLLHHPSGKLANWRNHLLEEKMFGSRTAGETFFDRLAKVSYETYSDSAVLLALYLAILRMGFLGRFRGLRDRGELDRLRIRALTRITEEVSYDASSNVPVSPSAYDSTLRLSEIVKTPLRGVWRELFVACVVLCLTASIVGWIHLLTPLDTQVDRILLKISTPIS